LFLTSPPLSAGSEANWNEERAGFFTGSSSPPSRRMFDSPQSETSSVRFMRNSPGLRRRLNTFGRMTPVSMAPSSSSGNDFSDAMTSETGSPSGTLPNREIWMRSMSQQEFNTTGPSNRSRLTTLWLRLWNAPSMFFGASPAPANRGERGQRPAPTHTLRIRGRSSGAATRAALTWSLMNSEEASTLDTYYGGLIDTPYLSRSRAALLYSARPPYGSPRTSPLRTGTRASTPERRRLFFDD